MLTQAEKGAAFAELHKRAGTFIIPNPWDVGSARLLAHLGFEALATSSAGYAFSLGKADNAVGRDGTLAHAAAVAAATGAGGGSIEDSTGRADNPLYERTLAVARIQAAAEVVHHLPFPFTLT